MKYCKMDEKEPCLGMIEAFCILIVLVVTQMYRHGQVLVN